METKSIPTYSPAKQTTLDTRLLQAVSQCSNLILRETNRTLEPFGFKLPQWIVFNEIVWSGPLNQKDICRVLGLEKSNVSKIVQILFKKEFIKVTPGPVDRRATLLTETPRGRDVWQRIKPVSDEIVARLTAGLSPPEKDQLWFLLQKISSSIQHN